jgi:type IV pilus assembly protein PilE
MPRSRVRGFTLIEVMLVVAIVGILALIAYPSYENQIRKSRRASAQSHLMDIAARQQQFLLDQRAYAASVAALNMTTPADVSAYYTITVTPNNAATPPSFSATAAPTGAQTLDKAGTLGITDAGVKTASGGAGYW